MNSKKYLNTNSPEFIIFGLSLAHTVTVVLLGLFWTIISQNWIPNTFDSLNGIFIKWDAKHYISIVTNGFTIQGKLPTIVFMPLFPGFVRLLSGGHVKLAFIIGYFFSFLAKTVSCYILFHIENGLHKLGQCNSVPANKRLTYWSVAFFLLNPSAPYHIGFFTESVFFAFTMLGVYSLFASPRQPLQAGIFGGLSALTRPVGFVFSVLIGMDALIHCIRERRFPRMREYIAVTLPVAAYLSWFIFIKLKYGSFAVWGNATAQWGRRLTTPWTSWNMSSFFPIHEKILLIFWLIVILWAITSMFRRNFPLSWIVYTLCLVIIYYTTGVIEFMTRYMSVVFVLPLLLAALAKQRHSIGAVLLVFMSMAQTLFLISYIIQYRI